MRHFLENSELKVEIDSFGAELKSVLNKNNYREYMWYGNGRFWGRTSPVLFPFVGSLKNKQYTWEGNTYPMGQHGFARDYEHEVVSKDDTSIWFSFKSSDETLARYPFCFELQIGYELTGNTLKVLWRVINPDTKTMYFQIGAHPAFLCPIHGEEDKTGYKLYFDGVNEIHHHGNIVSTGMALREDIIMPLDNGRALITKDFFDRCTIMVEGNQTGLVGIEDPAGERILDVKFNTPLFAIWSPEGKNAPFICIEPWYGRCDADDFAGDLSAREFTNVLGAGEEFSASYEMTFYQV